jgi:hypothetical protein
VCCRENAQWREDGRHVFENYPLNMEEAWKFISDSSQKAEVKARLRLSPAPRTLTKNGHKRVNASNTR